LDNKTISKGRLKKVFPGGNTARGFYSFYDYIIEPDATRIFIIKGGPGVGKSTFMRNIGEAMLERGYDVEFHCCSSDNDSLDGVVINSIKIAIIDGTAPHILDPKNPGAVDEIIHLGDYWNEDGLRANKRQIISCNKEVNRLFKHAYSYLAAAKLFLDEVESYYQDTGALDVASLDRLVLDLIHDIFKGKINKGHPPKIRRLFATAITPEGEVSHLETIVGNLKKRYVIDGDDGTGKTTLVKRILDATLMRGYDVEAYHCALEPTKIDHLVIPALDTAIINTVEPHFYHPKESDTVIDTMEFVNPVLSKTYLNERQIAREMYRKCFDQAVWFIAKAKEMHDEMEKYYAPNMNFADINKKREETLERILQFAREAKSA